MPPAIPVVKSGPAGPQTPAVGLDSAGIEIVVRPDRTNPKRVMFAVGGRGAEVYGLYGPAGAPTDQSFSGLQWEFIATLVGQGRKTGNVVRVGSFNGTTILAGTDAGLIFSVNTATGAVIYKIVPKLEGSSRSQLLPRDVRTRLVPILAQC